MWKYICVFSFLGASLLIVSRYSGSTLFYLGGYLFLLSYLIVTIGVITSGKKNGWSFSKNFKMVLLSFINMTLIYITYVWLS